MASIEYLTELVGGTDAVFEDAKADPKIAAKKRPTQDQVVAAVVKVIEKRSIAGAADLVRDDLNEALELYLAVNGPREDVYAMAMASEEPDLIDDYDSAMDDAVEAVFKPYADVLSNDWMAKETIDARLHEEGAVERLALAFGKEIYKQLAWQTGRPEEGGGKMKSPAQIMANAGITTSAVLGHFADRIGGAEQAPTVTTVQAAADADQAASAIAERILARVGVDFDELNIREELEMLVDDDEILAGGAGQRLGLDVPDIEAVQMLGLDLGAAGAVQALLDAMAANAALPPPEKPKRQRAPKAEAVDDDTVYLDPGVLPLLAAHSAKPSSAMAEQLGVSRATYNNYIAGKTKFAPDERQAELIRTQIVADVNGLLLALSKVDGAAAMQVE